MWLVDSVISVVTPNVILNRPLCRDQRPGHSALPIMTTVMIFSTPIGDLDNEAYTSIENMTQEKLRRFQLRCRPSLREYSTGMTQPMSGLHRKTPYNS